MLIITREGQKEKEGEHLYNQHTTYFTKKNHKKSIDNLNKIYKGEFGPSSLNENM